MHVSELWVYPIKSCAGIFLTEAELTEFNFRYDRNFVLVDERGGMLTQRKVPRMCLIETELTECAVLARAKGMRPFALSLDEIPQREALEFQNWEGANVGIDCGEDAARWFSEAIGVKCRILRSDPGRFPRSRWSDFLMSPVLLSFSDGYPILGISRESLLDLNSRIIKNGGVPIPMNRFRPNIVFAGGEPYAEDKWQKIEINGIPILGATLCTRCPIPQIDQKTGIAEKEPARTLAQYRRKRDLLPNTKDDDRGRNKVMFGRNLVHIETGKISLTDKVKVIS